MRNATETEPSSPNHHLTLRFLDSSLRLSTIPLTVSSIWVMVTNKEFNDVYGDLDYKSLSGFKYLVAMNGICAGYALLAIVFSWLRGRISDWVFFISDQVLAYLLVTSTSAVIELLFLFQRGDRDVSWSEACSTYRKYCGRVKVSLILHGMAFACFLVLSCISAYRVFSKFEAPYVSTKEGNEEVE
ncbi:CASP-like protein 2D1 [Aristolochia californica]|uniref:CASP-like protein 2D1 n=1 Tax=Aristolochia californica TaxID=171875 RepID=UPI0035D75B4F